MVAVKGLEISLKYLDDEGAEQTITMHYAPAYPEDATLVGFTAAASAIVRTELRRIGLVDEAPLTFDRATGCIIDRAVG